MNPTQLLQHFVRISEALDAIPRLRRFILDLAVRGKLVEQDPTDEPAAELIKRIRAEKLGLVKEEGNRHSGMDCRNPVYRDVKPSVTAISAIVPRGTHSPKLSLNPGIAFHGNWIPAIHAGMTT